MQTIRPLRRSEPCADPCGAQLRYAGLLLLSLPAIPLFIWGLAEIGVTLGLIAP
jgi:hypothetical protein